MKDLTKGILAILVSAFFLALSQTLLKYAGDLSVVQKMFFRSLVMVMFTGYTMLRKHIPLQVKRSFALPLVLRCCSGTVGNFCNLYSIQNMNLADATMLSKLSPFFTVFFAWVLMKEKFRSSDIIALCVAFIGTLFIIKPGGDLIAVFPAVIGLLGAIISGLTYASIHWCHKKGSPGELSAFAYAVVSCLVALPKVLFDYETMSLFQLTILISCGICGALSLRFVTEAYKYAQPNQISVFDYTQILYAAVLGFLFFSQLPDTLSICGYLIIVSTEIFKYRHDSRHRA